jgi:thiol-disulfide isomerase/thioredoxin
VAEPVRLTLLGREDCGLCEDMADALAALAAELPMPPVEWADVDANPEWQRRYGLKIPVLLWDDEPVAITRLDPEELRRLLRNRK